MLEIRLMDLEEQLRAARALCFNGQLPSDPMPVHVPLDKALEQYDDIVERIKVVSAEKERKESTRKQIDRLLRQFQGLEMQVAYKRDVEGKSLLAIATELGYSYDHIRRVSSRIKKVGGA